MNEKFYGGNQLIRINNKHDTPLPVIQFSKGDYSYFCVKLSESQTFKISDLYLYTIYFLEANAGDGQLIISDIEQKLNVGDSIDINKLNVEVKASNGLITILVAGVNKMNEHSETTINIKRKGEHYKVTKPWGHELWINGECPYYCLKEVFIKHGNRTSLQYHNFKTETNLLVSGRAELIYKNNEKISNDDVVSDDLGTAIMEPWTVLNISPKVLHRIYALSDIYLYETSTPYLDDVIRVSDDTGRTNGRVKMEHAS